MNEESLSALLDGELGAPELDRVLRDLERDPEVRARFSRLSALRALRSGSRVRSVDPGFADRVMAALERDPSQAARPAPATRPLPWRPAIGLALAAGFGALAVLVLRPEPEPAPAPPAVAAAPAVAPAAEVAGLDGAQAVQLRNYVMAYSQSRAQQGLGGTLGYARYAAYTGAPQRADER